MTYQRDLGLCTYFNNADRQLSTRLIAVGWLDRFEPYTHGSISPAQRAKLGELLADPWNPFLFLGSHECECGRSRPGFNNLFIPSPRGVYASPELIDHYIDVHDYRPPDEFLEAVEACPPMCSAEYLTQLEAGLGEFFYQLHRAELSKREWYEAVKAGATPEQAFERVKEKYG
jgi:hypothetical protein